MTPLGIAEWSALLWLAVGKLLTVPALSRLTQVPAVARRRVYALAPRRSQIRFEWSAWPLLLTDPCLLLLLIASGVLTLTPASWANSLGTFVFLFLWTDFWMYWTHRAMHGSRRLWRLHARHHRSRVTQASAAVSFSFGEKFFFYTLGWLLPLAAWSHVMAVSLLGIVAFYTFYFVSSPIAHANVELGSHPATWPMKALGTATSHALHHARIEGNYGFLTTIYDRVFGTYWSDSDEIHLRVVRGESLTQLRETKGSRHDKAISVV